jgi:acetoin utilization deacetylase AcuC-like enzyme
MITTYYHPGYAAPIGPHIMPIRKFGLVADALSDDPRVRLVEPKPVTEVDVLRVHNRAYVEAVRTGAPRELAESQKFPWSPQLYDSVLLTSGGCYAAARTALQDGVAAALVSGFHHSHAGRGEGFCTFNGLVIAIDRLLAEGTIRSAAILDCDLHYGNGTALLAAARPHMFALSIYGNDYWNNTPYKDVTICHHTDGDNHRSIALPNGCDGPTMMTILHDSLPLLLSHGKPGLLLYQAGADPYFEDPYSPLRLTHDDLMERDRIVFRFAKENAIPIAWVLAGGYTQDVRKVVKVHTNTFEAAASVYISGEPSS